MQTEIKFKTGDITAMAVEAIVNPANTDLRMETGVAGAIAHKGGKWIVEECQRIAPIPLGEAVVTTGGVLKAPYVIHAAAMSPGGKVTEESLRQAIHNTLLRTEGRAFKSIAIPAMGTGAGGLNVEESARALLPVILAHLKSTTSLETIIFVLADDETKQKFENIYHELTARSAPKSA
jgi:O-acetyl-ADP-ribose deacetylase (regulator of RNase III)